VATVPIEINETVTDSEFEYQTLGFTIKSISPLMMHNGQLADPLNPYSRAIKEITAKGKKKTADDLERMALLEWEGGLYIGEGDVVVIPGTNIEGLLVEGARKSRLGQQFSAGVLCLDSWPLIYDGPKTIKKLKDNAKFRDTRKASVNSSSVMRTRPIFETWSLKFEVMYLPSVVDHDQIIKALVTAGRLVGLCDYKPKYGRFRVVEAHHITD
jgi:hypothetical protein